MGFMKTRQCLLFVLCALVLSGCFARTNAGYSFGPEHPAVNINAHANFALWGAALRGCFAGNIQEVGLAVEGGIPFLGNQPKADGDFISYMYAGVNVLQLGLIDGDGRIGAGSPWLQLCGGWCTGDEQSGTCTTLNLDTEYSLRFGPFEAEPYIGVSLGFFFYNIPKFH